MTKLVDGLNIAIKAINDIDENELPLQIITRLAKIKWELIKLKVALRLTEQPEE